MAGEFHLICVGKLKDPGLEQFEQDFLKRLKNIQLTMHETKACADQPSVEAAEVLRCIEKISPRQNPIIILLDENGKSLTSTLFASWIQEMSEGPKNKIIFCIGGAMGHGPELKNKATFLLTLSSMTRPHRLARVIFVEQFYRAYTLNTGHPYHNA